LFVAVVVAALVLAVPEDPPVVVPVLSLVALSPQAVNNAVKAAIHKTFFIFISFGQTLPTPETISNGEFSQAPIMRIPSCCGNY
jgi:hypothetical protein